MTRSLLDLLVVGALLVANAITATANDAKEDAIKKDHKQIEGTWRVIALEVDGKKATPEDAEKVSVVNGPDGSWTLFSAGKEITKGTSTIDPTKQPKAIDFTATDEDGKVDRYLGIYKLDENTRKLCFAQTGKERPTEFFSTPGSEITFVTFERVKAE